MFESAARKRVIFYQTRRKSGDIIAITYETSPAGEERVPRARHSPRALRSRSSRAVLGKDLLLDSPVTEIKSRSCAFVLTIVTLKCNTRFRSSDISPRVRTLPRIADNPKRTSAISDIAFYSPLDSFTFCNFSLKYRHLVSLERG